MIATRCASALVRRSIGRDHGRAWYCRASAGGTAAIAQIERDALVRRRQTAELAVLLERPGPELRLLVQRDVAARVDGDQRADLQAVVVDGRGAAEPAFEIARLGA